jgi:exosortase
VIETLSASPADSSSAALPASQTPASGTDEPRPPVPGRGFLAPRYFALAVVVVVLGWSYAPNLGSLVDTWNRDPNYSHGFLVVPVALVILWRRWVEAESRAIRPAWWGWLALGGALVVRAACYERGAEWSETATLLLVVASLTLAAGGWPLLRTVWPAIAFLVFLLPLPQSINGLLSQPLQSVATLGSCALLKLMGLWVVAEGNVILVGADSLEVAAACNGLSMLMCLAATVTAMTLLVAMAPWKRVVLLVSIIPVALISNILRITATAWCYHLFGSAVGGHFAHDAAGWLMMPMALVLVGSELALMSWLFVQGEELPVNRPDLLLRRRKT